MMISTRGRYALRVMIDLAEHSDDQYIAMKELAERQDISKKYMEKVMPLLVSANLVTGVQGKGGGYKLTRRPSEYSVGEILRLTEGSLAPVACLKCDAEVCEKKEQCRTIHMWTELDRRITEYLDSVLLSDLMKKNKFKI